MLSSSLGERNVRPWSHFDVESAELNTTYGFDSKECDLWYESIYQDVTRAHANCSTFGMLFMKISNNSMFRNSRQRYSPNNHRHWYGAVYFQGCNRLGFTLWPGVNKDLFPRSGGCRFALPKDIDQGNSFTFAPVKPLDSCSRFRCQLQVDIGVQRNTLESESVECPRSCLDLRIHHLELVAFIQTLCWRQDNVFEDLIKDSQGCPRLLKEA